MKQREAPRIASEYWERIRDCTFTPRPRQERDYSIWHLTEGTTLCPEKDRLTRVTPRLYHPPKDRRTILKFFMGYIFEEFITTPCRIQREGISGEIDDFKLNTYLRELKFTHDSLENFKAKPWWIEQKMGYCYLAEVTESDLVTLFGAGNLMSYTPWGIKEINEYRTGKKKWDGQIYFYGMDYCPIDIKAWSFEYTDKEILENWKMIKTNIDLLANHVKLKQPFSKELIEARKPEWLCKPCEWKDLCWYYQEHMNKEAT